jgi:hypothetical protein
MFLNPFLACLAIFYGVFMAPESVHMCCKALIPPHFMAVVTDGWPATDHCARDPRYESPRGYPLRIAQSGDLVTVLAKAHAPPSPCCRSVRPAPHDSFSFCCFVCPNQPPPFFCYLGRPAFPVCVPHLGRPGLSPRSVQSDAQPCFVLQHVGFLCDDSPPTF